MSPNYLGFRIAFDRLRAGIPVGDVPLRVEVDRIIFDALDEEGEPPLAGQQLLVDRPLFRNVAGDLRKPNDVIVRVINRVNDYMRPKTRAVLPKTPALRFKAAIRRCSGERATGKADGAVLLRIENREVPTDDFLSRVALEALGPGIPRGDVPVRVQQIDGIVLHRVDEDLETVVLGDIS